MFDIGGPEFILLVILGLIIFGPRRLPEIGRQLGGFVAQMKMSMREFQGTIEREIAFEEVRQVTRQVTDAGRDVGQAVRQEAAGISTELSGIGPPPYADPARRARELTVAPDPPPDDAALPGAAAAPDAASEPPPAAPGAGPSGPDHAGGRPGTPPGTP